MTPRVHLPGAALRAGSTCPLPDDAAHHLQRVLRLPVGATIEVFDGEGGSARATLTADRPAMLRIDEALADEPVPPVSILLAQCVSTADKMDWTIEKAVELGATTIVPLLSARTIVRLDARRSASRDTHWRRIVVAACAQSGRNRLPALLAPMPLADWLARPLEAAAPATIHRWLLDPQADRSLPQALAGLAASPAAGATAHWLLCGPESGLAPAEIEQARGHGWQGIRLGPRVLRTETAGLAAITTVQVLAGDLA